MLVKKIFLVFFALSIAFSPVLVTPSFSQQHKREKVSKEENKRLRAERKKSKMPEKKVKKEKKKKVDYPFNN
jgi:hypothetical protein